MNDKINPLMVFASAFAMSSFAGLAALLRGGKKIDVLSVTSSVLNSGLIGLAISLLWFTRFQENIYFLVGVCILAGLGGTTMVDFVLTAFKNGGLAIKFGPDGSGLTGGKEDEPTQ